MKTDIGLNAQERLGVVQILNRLLADEYVLLVKTKNYHWNVAGPHFSELHKFFDEQYEQISGFTDDVAERSRSLGENAVASLKEFLQLATLKETDGKIPSANKMVENLLKDHEQVIRSLRKDLQDCVEKFHDAGTSDFLTGLMEEHEKMSWMLRSFL